MIISLYFICVFAVLINKVCLQVTVQAVIGGSVVLPCSSTQHDIKLQDINVHWRQNNRKIVHDIINGKDSVDLQDSRYKNRAETFPNEYLKGNFSLRLNNLIHADAGKYNCLISHSFEPKTVELIINAKENKSSEEQNKGEDTGADSEQTSSSWVYFVVATLLIFLIIVCFIIIGYRKKIQAALFSPVRNEDKQTNDINV